MNQRLRNLLLSACLLAATSTPAATITLDFDDGPASGAVGSFYASSGVEFGNASFSSFGHLPGGSPPRTIVATDSWTQPTPATPIVASFGMLVESVTVRGIDVGANGIRMDAYDAAGVLLGFGEAFGTGLGIGHFYDLTVTGSGIRRVEFYQPRDVTGDGVAWDDLSFETPRAPIPEPGTLLLLGSGLLGLARAGRRRTRR